MEIQEINVDLLDETNILLTKIECDNIIGLIINDIHRNQSFKTKQKQYWIRLETKDQLDLTNSDCQYISDEIKKRKGVNIYWNSNREIEVHL